MAKNKYLQEKLRTGVPGLDVMIWGGLIPSTLTVIDGASGTGKSALGWQMLVTNAERGNKGLLISLGRDPEDIQAWAETFNWLASEHIHNNTISIRTLPTPWDTSKANSLARFIKKEGISLVVIDALDPSMTTKKDGLITWAKHFSEWVQKLPCYNVLLKQDAKAFEAAGALQPSIPSETIINLGFMLLNNVNARILWLTKRSGGPHSQSVHLLHVDANGVSVGSVIQPGENTNPVGPREKVLVVENFGRGFMQLRKTKIKINEKFMENNPLVSVEERSANTAIGFWTDSHSMVESWEGLGVVCVSDQIVRRHLKSDFFYPLTEVIDKSNIDILNREAWAPFVQGSEYYGISENMEIPLLWCRKDLLQKHGFDLPKSWKDILVSAEKIIKKEDDPDLWGLAFKSGGACIQEDEEFANLMMTLLGAAGNSLTDLIDDENDPALLATLNFLKEAQDRGVLCEEWRNNTNPWDGLGKWKDGKVLYFIGSSDLLHLHQWEKIGFPLKHAVPIPMPPAKGVKTTKLWRRSSTAVIPKNTPDPELALNYFRTWLMVLEQQCHKMEYRAFPPISKPFKDQRVHKKQPDYKRCKPWLEASIPLPLIKNYSYWCEHQRKAIQDVINGFEQPKDVAKSLAFIPKLCADLDLPEPVSKALECLRVIPLNRISVELMASECHVSARYLNQVMNESIGIGPKQLVVWWKMERAKHYLKDTTQSIKNIGNLLGYKSEASFSRAFKDATSYRPGEYKSIVSAQPN